MESPLKFTSRVVQSPSDNRPVRIKYFGSFVQKGYFNKTTRMEKKVNELLENIDEVALLMAGVLEFITIRSAEDAKKYIEIARDNIDIDKIDFIYDKWKSY